MSTSTNGAKNALNSQPTTRRGTPTAPVLVKVTKKTLQEAIGMNTDVRNVEEAHKILQAGQYLTPGTPVTPAILSFILFQLSSSIPKPSPLLLNGIRAVGFLLEEVAADAIAEAIATSVMAKLKDSFQEIQNATQDMGSATNGIKDAAAKNLVSLDSIRGDLGELSEKVTQVSLDVTERPPPSTETTTTHIDIPIPPQHAAAITQGNAKSRQIYVRTTPGMDDNGLSDLTEQQLVTKAQIAFEYMGLASSDAPAGTAFVGAKKLRSGVIQYQLSSEQSTAWIQDETVMKAFMEHFGGTYSVRSQLLYTVAEYVPVAFNPDAQAARDVVENHSGLARGTMVHAKYIKPAHRRSSDQKVAHAIVGYSVREAANHAIEHGLYVEGKLVLTRKLLPEPKRCLKCQMMGTNHIAAQCKSIHDVCGKCAGMHRTESCGLTDRQKFRCSNCHAGGHGAVDRQCPYFLAQLKRLHDRIPDTRYKYYPTNDPKTWELVGQSDLHVNDQDATWQQGMEWQGGWTQVQHGKHRQGTGRLAGGRSGEGGGGKQGGLWGRTEGGGKQTGNTRFQANRVPDNGWPKKPAQQPIDSYFTAQTETWADEMNEHDVNTYNAETDGAYTPLIFPDSPTPVAHA